MYTDINKNGLNYNKIIKKSISIIPTWFCYNSA